MSILYRDTSSLRSHLTIDKIKQRRSSVHHLQTVTVNFRETNGAISDRTITVQSAIIDKFINQPGKPVLNFLTGDLSSKNALTMHTFFHNFHHRQENYGHLLRSQFEHPATSIKKKLIGHLASFKKNQVKEENPLLANLLVNGGPISSTLADDFPDFDANVDKELNPALFLFFHPSLFIIEMAYETVGSKAYELIHRGGSGFVSGFSSILDIIGLLLNEPFYGVRFSILAGQYDPVYYVNELTDEEIAMYLQLIGENLGFSLFPPTTFLWDPKHFYIFGEPWGGRYDISELPYVCDQIVQFKKNFLSFIGYKKILWDKLQKGEHIDSHTFWMAVLDVGVFLGELVIAVELDPFMKAMDLIVEGAMVVAKVEFAALSAVLPIFSRISENCVRVYADIVGYLEKTMSSVVHSLVLLIKDAPKALSAICAKADMLTVTMFGLKLSPKLKSFFNVFSTVLKNDSHIISTFHSFRSSPAGKLMEKKVADFFGYEADAALETNVKNILKKMIDMAVQRLAALRRYVAKGENLTDEQRNQLNDLDRMAADFVEYSVEAVGGDVHGFAPSMILAVYFIVVTTAVSLIKRNPLDYNMTPVELIDGMDVFIVPIHSYIDTHEYHVDDDVIDAVEKTLSGAKLLTITPQEFEKIFQEQVKKITEPQWDFFLDQKSLVNNTFLLYQQKMWSNQSMSNEERSFFNYLYAHQQLYIYMMKEKKYYVFEVITDFQTFLKTEKVNDWLNYVFDVNAIPLLLANAPTVENPADEPAPTFDRGDEMPVDNTTPSFDRGNPEPTLDNTANDLLTTPRSTPRSQPRSEPRSDPRSVHNDLLNHTSGKPHKQTYDHHF